MLVFIDESGDSGLKLGQGSSRYFTVALVVFDDYDEAQNCDQRIELLAKEIGWLPYSEFHFKRNSDKERKAFLKAVAPYNFFYYGIVIDKNPKKIVLGKDFIINTRFINMHAVYYLKMQKIDWKMPSLLLMKAVVLILKDSLRNICVTRSIRQAPNILKRSKCSDHSAIGCYS